MLAVLICTLAQRLIFPAHIISNKQKSLEVFLQCTNGSALHPTQCRTGLVLLVISLELCLKSQEEKRESEKLPVHSQKLLVSVSVSSSGSSTGTGLPVFGWHWREGCQKYYLSWLMLSVRMCAVRKALGPWSFCECSLEIRGFLCILLHLE